MNHADARYADRIETPVGTLLAVVDERGALVALDFEGALDERVLEQRWRPRAGTLAWEPAKLGAVRRALERYFAGELRDFELELAPTGTPFQLRVWDELTRIPYGQTISYAELARRLGSPRAVRAVGSANGANPIPIVIPCHRVIGADGTLTGYGGGLETKRALLELEGVLPRQLCESPRPLRLRG